MGASTAGLAIRVDISKYDLDHVVKELFGNEYEKRNNSDRESNYTDVYIGKTKDFLVILSSEIAFNFFESQHIDSIQRFIRYFNNPDFIFAFEEYDSGGTYSYALIYNGEIKRIFRSVSYETKTDIGELEQVELKWKNAEVITEDLGDGEIEIIYKDPTKDFSCSKDNLPLVILQELMHEKLGFISWNMDEYIVEQGYFEKKSNKITEKQKKSWWKIW